MAGMEQDRLLRSLLAQTSLGFCHSSMAGEFLKSFKVVGFGECSVAIFCPILVLALNRATFELSSFKNTFMREETRSLNHWKHLSRSNLISEIPASPWFVNKREFAFLLARETPGLKACLLCRWWSSQPGPGLWLPGTGGVQVSALEHGDFFVLRFERASEFLRLCPACWCLLHFLLSEWDFSPLDKVNMSINI